MVFIKVDEHTIRCIIKNEEITQMGYDLEHLMREENQEQVQQFLEDVSKQAKKSGIELTERFHAVQSIILPGNHLALSFSDIQPSDQVDHLIHNFLDVADAVETLGRETFEAILDMDDSEKVPAFWHCMEQLKKLHQAVQKTPDDAPKKQNSSSYLLTFSTLKDAERFSKAVPHSIPGTLYKANLHSEKSRYCIVLSSNDQNEKILEQLLLLAHDFADHVVLDHHHSRVLQEHAEVLIKENPLDVLRSL